MDIRELKWCQEELDKMKPLDTVNFLVVHHTDSGDVSVEEIDRWHRNMGWIGCGYHYVIRVDGNVEKGRPENKRGAHAYGYNHNSLGIALIGNFMDAVPSPAQIDVLVELLMSLQRRCLDVEVVRHRDLCQTSCPGDMFPWKELVQRLQGGREIVEAVKIKVAGKELEGHIIDGHSFGPARDIAEALNATVIWDESTKTVTITPPDRDGLYAENQRLKQLVKQIADISASFMVE